MVEMLVHLKTEVPGSWEQWESVQQPLCTPWGWCRRCRGCICTSRSLDCETEQCGRLRPPPLTCCCWPELLPTCSTDSSLMDEQRLLLWNNPQPCQTHQKDWREHRDQPRNDDVLCLAMLQGFTVDLHIRVNVICLFLSGGWYEQSAHILVLLLRHEAAGEPETVLDVEMLDWGETGVFLIVQDPHGQSVTSLKTQ